MSEQSGSGEGRGGAAPQPTEPTRYVGLLTQVMTNTLDADYEEVSRHAAESGKPTGRLPSGVLAVLAAFGLLIGVSALKTEQDRPQANAERAEIIDQIHGRQDELDGLHNDLTSLQGDVASLQNTLADDVNDSQELTGELTALGVASGALAVTGPGVTITVNDAPPADGPGGVILDVDLQALVNALWEAGAETIAIEGHRLTSLSSITYAGQAITVDYSSLTPPYVIDATGDPDTLPGRLLQTEGGQTWLGLRSNFGITFDVATKEKVTVPAFPHDHLLYATAEGGGL